VFVSDNAVCSSDIAVVKENAQEIKISSKLQYFHDVIDNTTEAYSYCNSVLSSTNL
jgi:hypothetical protein